jgi:hypothetical protein
MKASNTSIVVVPNERAKSEHKLAAVACLLLTLLLLLICNYSTSSRRIISRRTAAQPKGCSLNACCLHHKHNRR